MAKTKTLSLSETFERYSGLYQPIPDGVPAHSFCFFCCGPISGEYPRCFGCNRVFFQRNAPAELRGRIVPMTSATNPGPWYTRLAGYKGARPDYGTPIAALIGTFYQTHTDRFEELLGGPVYAIATVPSKRGVAFKDHQLPNTVMRLVQYRALVQDLVRFKEGEELGGQHNFYEPTRFEAVDAKGKRILLIEDVWVSGATAVSAAGALLDGGASAVVVSPVARVVSAKGFHAEDHPYILGMDEPYDVERWPKDL